MTTGRDPQPLIERAKRYAALSGLFEPARALPAETRDDPSIAATVASALAEACDTNPNQGSGWLLRTGERRYIIQTLSKKGLLADEIAKRRSTDVDPTTNDLLSTLLGEGDFSKEKIADALDDKDSSQEQIARIVTALDRAGTIAPGHERLDQARVRLAAFDRQERRRQLKARGFFGRTEEKALLEQWFDEPIERAPARAALLTGLPGIGKSALLEEMVDIVLERSASTTIRLDFDRAGLDVVDVTGLTMEVARQIADRAEKGDPDLLRARLQAASSERGGEDFAKAARASFPQQLADQIGTSVSATSRPVLLVLDTLEVLRARGARQIPMLFDWIDRLVDAGVVPLRILAAGRGDVFDTCPERCWREPIALGGLEDEAARKLLDLLGVAAREQDAIVAIADGVPLVLRLAANVVKDHGVANLPAKKLSGDVTAAYLYRFLLSRIIDPDLKRLAHPGLIASRISAAFLQEVLAPQVRMKRLNDQRAKSLFEALAEQHWLVERDPADPEFVKHRSDMRSVLLKLLYKDAPGLCARVDTAAVRWFARRPDRASQFDAAYHSLQLMRTRPTPPMISAEIARMFDPTTLSELTEKAQNVVTLAAGGTSSSFAPGATLSAQPVDETEAVQGLLNVIERADWVEGQYVVDQIEKQGGFDARGQTADAVRAFHWRAGHWRQVRQMLRERDRLGADDSDLSSLPFLLAIARLEMRAEFAPRMFRNLLGQDQVTRLLGDVDQRTGVTAERGAVAFLRRASGAHLESSWQSKDGDPAAAAFELWASGEGKGPASAHAFGVARDRLSARHSGSASQLRWDDPQLLATLTPYAAVAATLATQPDEREMAAAAEMSEAQLAGAGALLADDDVTFAVSSQSNIAGIAGLGLFAEWAALHATLTRNGNLREIARAAERWRRTVAGDWRLGPRPREWQGAGPIDRTLASRISLLTNKDDPAKAALDQLALWGPNRDGETLRRIIERRFARTLIRASQASDPIRRARALLDGTMPAAVVPPMVVLINHPISERSM
jgi:hypothetical protein